MNSEQLQQFKTITLDYFGKLTNVEQPPALGEAYLQFAEPVMLDYTSIIEISGESQGCIYMTSNTRMMEALLALHGEEEMSDRTRMDMCRELSNVLAGNAMHAFGDDWQISVPRTLHREDMATLNLPPSTFVMPIEWRDGRSYLVIGLTHNAA
jgi:CheY-specific phosphatase CheX